MSFSFEQPTPHIVTVEVGEFLEFRNAGKLKARLKEYVDQGVRKFVFNLEQTQLIDSSGLGALITLYRQIKDDEEATIILAGVRDEVKSTLELTNTDQLFTVVENFKEAAQLLDESDL